MAVIVRRATLKDVEALTTIYADAFRYDNIVQSFITYLPERPNDYRNFILQRNKLRLFAPDLVLNLAETEDGVVVGYTVWERKGSSPTAKSWQQDTLRNRIRRFFVTISWRVRNWFNPNQSEQPGPYAQIGVLSEAATEPYPERWHLHVLVVARQFQRRGIGGKLMEWGIEQAVKEKVPIALEASEVGLSLYRKIGFKVVDMLKLDAGIQLPVMLWTPQQKGQ